MCTKEITKTLRKCIPTRKLFLLQEFALTNANDDVRFLTRGTGHNLQRIERLSKVSHKVIFERRLTNSWLCRKS